MITFLTRAIGVASVISLLGAPAYAQSTTTEESSEMTMQEHSHGDGSEMTMSGDMEKMGETIVLGDLELSGAFTRAMPPAAVAGGGFVTIKNTGSQDDRLVSASSMVSAHVETHIMTMDGDVMKMQSQPEGFVIPAGGMLELKPGGKHLMFIGVEKPFVEGQNVMVTLVFENAGSVDLMLHAIPVGAMAMEHGNMDHGSMDHSTMSSDSNSN